MSWKFYFIWTNQSIRSVDSALGPKGVEKLTRSPLRMGFGRPDALSCVLDLSDFNLPP